MSIDKWLSEKDSKEERIKREKAFRSLSEGEVKDLKKKKIRNIVKKDDLNAVESPESDKFIDEILEFKEWLNQRTYLKGDIEKIETWIKNLNLKIETDKSKEEDSNYKKKIIKEYKSIPPNFLDEKTRVAINKKIHGTERTNSDNYYLRKLKKTVQEKLNESKYYEILDGLLNLL
jgi:deoxyadenosine/deoxycytidine kinase